MIKYCPKCEKSLDISFFYKRKDGYLSGWCKSCQSKYVASSRTIWKMKNRERLIWLSAKHNAKKKNVPFKIEIKDISIPSICPVFNIPLDSHDHEHIPSIDCLIPKLGYVLGNIFVISTRANRIKSDASKEDLIKLIEYITINSK